VFLEETVEAELGKRVDSSLLDAFPIIDLNLFLVIG
jgi:hypothetical protein